jgi:DNA-binding transcriptional MerR regulator
MSKPPTDPLLSANEAGAALGVTGASLRRWVREAKINPSEITPSGYYQFRMSDLQRQRAALSEIRLPARRYEIDPETGRRRLVRDDDEQAAA